MPAFYFTFGNGADHPFDGGWLEVIAASKHHAAAMFREHYPDKEPGVANCAGIYSAHEFLTKPIYRKGNFDKFCHGILDYETSDELIPLNPAYHPTAQPSSSETMESAPPDLKM